MTEPPKYAYPYPTQGYYQAPPPPVMPSPQYYAVYAAPPPPAMAPPQYYAAPPPPVMAPPQYYVAPPPRREPGFFEGCLAALRCCCLLDEYCCDPSILFISDINFT